jgi:predicted RNase H-like HicB family nuclease
MRMTRHFPIIIEQDKDGVYIVECPVFQGCRSYGYTVDEAMENIQEAIAVCCEEEAFDGLTAFVGVRDLEIAVP